jgi:hypothetical protein
MSDRSLLTGTRRRNLLATQNVHGLPMDWEDCRPFALRESFRPRLVLTSEEKKAPFRPAPPQSALQG